jgi:hypothetical protein
MDSLSWISHPAIIRKKATVATLIFIGIILAIVYYMTTSILMVLLALVIFSGALSTYFFPTRYEISPEKIKIKYIFTKVEKDMSMFRSYYPDKRGVLLSPFTRPSRLENFRGIYLRYHDNKDEVDSFVRKIFKEKKSDS